VGVLSIFFGWFGFLVVRPGFFPQKNPRQIFKIFAVDETRERSTKPRLSDSDKRVDSVLLAACFQSRFLHYSGFVHFCPIRCVPRQWHPY
jgi:hypothetical protein